MKYGLAIWSHPTNSGYDQALRVVQKFTNDDRVLDSVGTLDPYDNNTPTDNGFIYYPTFFVVKQNGQFFDVPAMYHGTPTIPGQGGQVSEVTDKELVNLMNKALSGSYDNNGDNTINETGNNSILNGNGSGGLGFGGNRPGFRILLMIIAGAVTFRELNK